MSDKVTLSFSEISQRLKSLILPELDVVVGIASGGTVPAALVAHQLGKPLVLLRINFRARDNLPRYEQPLLLAEAPTFAEKQRLLLVDDVSVTGSTLKLATTLLCGHQITTLVLKGQADFVLFPEVASCVNWPWNPLRI